MHKIVRTWRWQLPHWEVENGTYFITMRCAGSLPTDVQNRLTEAARSTLQAEAKSEQFRQLQRRYFFLLDSYLDTGLGFAPFVGSSRVKQALLILLDAIHLGKWQSGPLVLMPNHLHFVARPSSSGSPDLETFLTQFKGRSSRYLNQLLKRTGRLWQYEWFDHWIRSDSSLERIRRYIQQNPVKAGLCADHTQFPGYHDGSIETVVWE